MQSPKHVAELLLSLDNIIISAHIGPDGDAVGSVSALLLALLKLDKKACAVLETFPRKFLQISGAGLIGHKPVNECGAFIALDCADKARLGVNTRYFDKAKITVNIDHHISNRGFAMENYIDVSASATAEIIYQILKADNSFVIDKEIASALYAGILYDTGGFRHPSTTSRTYRIAGDLIDCGADFSGIYKRMFNTRKYEELQIMATAFKNIQREFDGRLVWTSITAEELAREGAKAGDLDCIVDYLKSVAGSEIAAFYYQKSDKEFKVSLRSEPGVDISKIAEKFGGGGHKNAAGCSFFTTLEYAVATITKEIEAVFERDN